jgi:cardiolipin synthase A/B
VIACLLVVAIQPVQARTLAPANKSTYNLIGEPTPSGKDPLVTLIDLSKISVLVETNALTDPTVSGALTAARRRGVDVRVMTDPHSASSGATLASLAAADIWTRRGNPAISGTGETAVVLDRTTLALSNAPLTINARTGQRRFLMVDYDPMDVQQAASVFYDDWERRTPNRFGTNTVLGPPDYETGVISAINRSSHTLDIMVEALTSQAVVQAIAGAALRQVKVRVLFNPGVPASTLQKLQLAGAVVRLQNTGFLGAALAVDGSRLLLGSAPLTDVALQQQRQLGLFVKDGVVSSVFATIFDNDWRGATPIAAPTLTPTATLKPTPKPTPKGGFHTPTPIPPTSTPTRARPTPTPPLTATPSALTLIPAYNSSVRIGGKQQIIVRTVAGAKVSIVVTYPDGTTSNPGTTSGTADPTGSFVDSWTIALTAVPGQAKAVIKVSGFGQPLTDTISFRITF